MLAALPHSGLSRGFTLVELVIVMILLSILCALAIPKFFGFSADTKIAAPRGSLGSMRESIGGAELGALDPGVA